MAQVEQFKGKLGFEHRSEEKMTLALSELVDTLEDFGHPPLQIHARESHRITLDSDQYKVTLRLRRIPLRLGVRTPKGVPVPAAYIEVALVPVFADACDREISEILLAMILKRMTEALDPLVIFWQDTSKALTAREFLGAFAQNEQPEPEPIHDSPAITLAPVVQGDACAAAPAATALLQKATADQVPEIAPAAEHPPVLALPDAGLKPISGKMAAATARLRMADQARAEAEAERARGQALFGSVEETSPLLEQHCEEIEQQLSPKLKNRFRRVRKTQSSYQAMFGNSRLDWILAVPRTLISAPGHLLRSADLVLSVRAVITAMVVLFLHGSGMVQAAARVFLP